jgi:glycerophosphoryl diester phosphodiesterase
MTGAKGMRDRTEPIVIAHRGASAYRPEHTLGAYRLAIEMGADYIEPDLVPTKDGVLVARHENEISGTTDVTGHAEFAGRRTTKEIDGREVTGWFTEDFTLAELRTLRARERLPELRRANTAFDGRWRIPTLQEVAELAVSSGVGIYPETKHPTYFASIGLALEEPLVPALEANGLADRGSPVFIQSFEAANLKELARQVRVPLVQLVSASGAGMTTPEGLREIAGYASAIGPDKRLVVPRDEANRSAEPTSLVADAHAAGLAVHPYTFRPESEFLPDDLRDDPAAELARFYELGVDGVFADHPDTAVAVRDRVIR